VGKDEGSLGDRMQISGEAKLPQVFENILGEYAEGSQIIYVVICESDMFDVLDNLFKARGDAESTVIGHTAKEVVEVGPLILFPDDEVSTNHGQLVEVCQER
jgi:tRNA U34 2-thiouridine synthase MnmA/TrmU